MVPARQEGEGIPGAEQPGEDGLGVPNDVAWVIDIEFFRFGYDEK